VALMVMPVPLDSSGDARGTSEPAQGTVGHVLFFRKSGLAGTDTNVVSCGVFTGLIGLNGCRLNWSGAADGAFYLPRPPRA